MRDLSVEETITVRRALLNFIGLMETGQLEGQQPDSTTPWSDEYVASEIARCRNLLEEPFAADWFSSIGKQKGSE
jgi:hypothetical protein